MAMAATRSTSAASRGSVEGPAEVPVEVVEEVRQESVVDNRRPRLICLPVLQQGQQCLKSKRAQKVSFRFMFNLKQGNLLQTGI